MKTFELHRHQDETGVSGTGIIAQGVVFDDGSAVLHWVKEPRTTTLFPTFEAVKHIHGHQGKTQVVWTGDPFGRGAADCQQDRCENAPYGSVGGLARAHDPVAPAYITASERNLYLSGYRLMARSLFGEMTQAS